MIWVFSPSSKWFKPFYLIWFNLQSVKWSCVASWVYCQHCRARAVRSFYQQKKLSLPSESGSWKILSEPDLISLHFCNSQLFITVMDKLRLEIRAMDEVTSKQMHMLNLKQIRVPGLCVVFNVQIQPDLRELMETMNRMSNMPPDSEAKDKVSLWFVSSAGALHNQTDLY